MKNSGKKDSRLNELYETASDQFFLQDTAELYANLIQLIREESWAEAKEKVDSGLQKEAKHRLLTLRAIQLGLILNQNELVTENAKNAESNFSDYPVWKIFNAWISLTKNEPKEAYRILSTLWGSDKKIYEKTELAVLAFLQSIESTKHSAEWSQLSKIIQKHPEWVGVRVWRLKNKSFTATDRKKEILQLTDLFHDPEKLKSLREKGEKDNFYFYQGLISLDKVKAQFEELVK